MFRGFLPDIIARPGQSVVPHLVARYDGSTPGELKPEIRQFVRVLLTNPDMLHAATLAWHDKHWQRFLRNVKLVILDEAHDYRGTFGGNVALVLRRLLLLCDRYGTRPRFIATSATMTDPAGHLRSLTGRNFAIVPPENDGSEQGPKSFWIVRPMAHAFGLARVLMRDLVNADLSVLTFCSSRRSAEQLAADFHEDDARIAVYKSGLLAERREEIEEGLRGRAVRGVFATSALELGIDIGALDVCICIGLPNTMMSLWQRAGRVGRAGKPGAVILIPEERPLDAYYAENPVKLFSRENEALALNLNSRALAIWHYACALKEANRELDVLAPSMLPDPLRRIAEEHCAGLDDQSFHNDDVHFHYNIRAGADLRYTLVGERDQKVGEINRSQILRETAPHAIYLHDRGRYRVLSVKERSKEVRLRPERSFNRTEAFVRVSVRVQQVWRLGHTELLSLEAGRLLVTESLLSLKERSRDGKLVKEYNGSQGLSANILPTTGVLFTVRKPALLLRGRESICTTRARSGWNGLAPVFRGLLPAVLGPCDLGDFGIHAEWSEERARLFFYDQAFDGIDLTISVVDRFVDLLQVAETGIRECDCNENHGCFRCVRDPFVNVATEKMATLELLVEIGAALARNPLVILDNDPIPDRMAATGDRPACRECGKVHRVEDKFCPNCGCRSDES